MYEKTKHTWLGTWQTVLDMEFFTMYYISLHELLFAKEFKFLVVVKNPFY